jgi:hypothetical protein
VIPDAEVLAFAIAEPRSVVTLNRRHFIQLHHTIPEHAGIVVCPFDPDFAALALRIHTELEARPQMAGQLVRIHRSGEQRLDSVFLINRRTRRQLRCAPLPPVCFVVRPRMIREVKG